MGRLILNIGLEYQHGNRFQNVRDSLRKALEEQPYIPEDGIKVES